MRSKTIDAAIATLSSSDTSALEGALFHWCKETWPRAVLNGVRSKSGSGASSELIFLDIDKGEGQGLETLVLRLNSRWPVYPIQDLHHQGRCLEILGRALPSSLKVAKVEAVETRILAGIDRPFLAMSYLEGRLAPDQPAYVLEGWLYDLDKREREQLWHAGVAAMLAVHNSHLSAEESKELSLPLAGETALQRMLNYWSLFLRHVESNGDYPVLRAAVSWLHDNQPNYDSEPRLVWGDASLRNMMFEGLAPSALLDFEFAHLGLWELDVAFYPLMDFVMADGFAGGAERLSGFAGLSDTMDYYEALSGRKMVHREYFLRMALSYMALSTTRVYQRLAINGSISSQAVYDNPPLQLLEDIMSGKRALPA
ncbi:phosphotransferase family protein [Parahaliea sp. F7430]|uniref:Phosphotransferase family protein n=1 Tax=Sediminihaliea albiluteola TaxID=2758564 RepID=A0A7W2TXJ2_9GAMM|nr:phosphotransferase family protein [Sediminihaliea albiluteola]MBA6413772.1 phosphotransferase family protein [Sediminihaliea albiluteola]